MPLNTTPKKPKILCIDDEESVLKALKRVLDNKFAVTVCTNAEDAITELNKNSFAIILSDLHLPKMNGIELLKQAKKISPTTIRTIFSGQIDMNNMMDAINNAEIDRFILKPWDNNYLELQMLESLQRHILLNEKNHLQHLATTDLVSGLTNHRYFQDTLKKEIERAERHNRVFTLIIYDVDNFKKFNDQYGHQQGDNVLFTISQSVLQQIRRIDSASRYGGEEFTIILPDTAIKPGFDVAERVRQAIANIHWPKPIKENVTISLGIVEFPTHGKNPEELIAAADDALYRAKDNGRNCSALAQKTLGN